MKLDEGWFRRWAGAACWWLLAIGAAMYALDENREAGSRAVSAVFFAILLGYKAWKQHLAIQMEILRRIGNMYETTKSPNLMGDD